MSSLSIVAQQVPAESMDEVFEEKMEKIANIAGHDDYTYDRMNPYDRSIIIVFSEKSTEPISQLMKVEGAKHLLFKENSSENGGHMEMFENGDVLVALTSFGTFEKLDFPVARHYIIADFPSKPAKLGRLLNELDAKAKKEEVDINVTFLVSQEFDEKTSKDALVMEMEIRGCEVPRFLKNDGSASKSTSTSSLPSSDHGTISDSWKQKMQDLKKFSTTSSDSGVQRRAPKRKSSTPIDDYRTLKMNKFGKYVLPAPRYDDSDSDEEENIGEEYEALMPSWMFRYN